MYVLPNSFPALNIGSHIAVRVPHITQAAPGTERFVKRPVRADLTKTPHNKLNVKDI